jgi:regulator of protease activity HflC (stomatin/prohibitin superfamily)
MGDYDNIGNDFLYFIVDAGYRAVIFDKFRGVQSLVVGEGTHFKIPFIQVYRDHITYKTVDSQD